MKVNNDKYGFVYMVTEKGGFAGYLYILPIEQCQAFCEDKRSAGRGRQGSWIFMWTTLVHAFSGFDDEIYEGDKRRREFLILKDTGRQDDLFEELGVEKPTFEWMDEVVGEYGFKLKYKK